jgi:hypothetical protein
MDSLAPQNITKDDWYYEYPSHMILVQRHYDQDGGYTHTSQMKIYWRQLKQSMDRAYKPKKKKSTKD